MPAVPTWLGSVAAGMAISSYVDAKFSLSSDVENLLSRRAAFAGLTKAGKIWTPFPLQSPPPAHTSPGWESTLFYLHPIIHTFEEGMDMGS